MEINPKFKALVQELVKLQLKEDGGAGGFSGAIGYNLPLLFTEPKNYSSIFTDDKSNPYNKKKRKKKKTEQKLKEIFENNPEFKKIVKEQNSDFQYEQLKSFIKNQNFSFLLEADDVVTNENDTNESTLNKANSVLYEIGLRQLPYIYNNVFNPYFQWIKINFDSTNKDCNKILLAYITFQSIIQKIKSKNLDDKTRELWQSTLETSVLITKTLQILLKKLNTTPLKTPTSQQIQERIQNNSKIVSQLIAVLFSPIQSNYIAALGSIDAYANTNFIITQNDFKNFDTYVTEVSQLFSTQQTQILNTFFQNHANDIYGSWLRTKIQTSLKNISAITQKIPPITVQHDNSEAIIQQFIQKSAIAIKNPQQGDLASFIKSYNTAFETISSTFSEYNQSLLEYIKSLQFKKTTNSKDVLTILNQGDPGFFNQHPQAIANAIIKTLKQTSQDKDQEKTSNTTATKEQDTFLSKLGLQLSESEDKFLSILLDSLLSVNKNKDGVIESISLEGIQSIPETAKALQDAIKGTGSLVELIQNWLAIALEYKIMLYADDKYFFENLKENIDANIEESETSRVGPLLKLLDSDSFQGGKQKGHSLNWTANENTKKIISGLLNLKFCQNLKQLEEEQIWKDLFFNQEFYKNKLFSEGGAIPNTDDVEEAEQLESKSTEKSSDVTSSKQFITNIKRLMTDLNISEDAQNKINATSFKNIVYKYNGRNALQNVDDDAINTIGIIIFNFVSTYYKRFEPNFGRIKGSNLQTMAKGFASNLLHSGGNIPNKEDVDDLSKTLWRQDGGILNYFNSKGQQQMKEKKVDKSKQWWQQTKTDIGLFLESIKENIQ